MSLPSDCAACATGDHSRHDRDHGLAPGLIGGMYCDCSGDCAERWQAAMDALGLTLTLGLPPHRQCSYCLGWYPEPVELHHSDAECLAAIVLT